MKSLFKYCLVLLFLAVLSCRPVAPGNHNADNIAGALNNNNAQKGTNLIRPASYIPTAAMAGTLSDEDLDFLLKASTGNMLEVELGKMAQDKAAHIKVKDFGEWMIQENSKGADLLQSLASSKGIILPESISESAQMERNYFQFKTDDDFDLCYINRTITDHKNYIRDFEKEARDGADPDVKSFAQKSLSQMRRHLGGAQDVWKGMQTP
jgi:putative membrane protein